MIISGKKVVVLTEAEKRVLQTAEELLDALDEALGSESGFDFNEVAEFLHYIRYNPKFEVDFTQE